MKRFVLRFDATGTGHAFFTEAIDLSAIGRLEISRATTLEFHNERQVWEVKDGEGLILFADPSRSVCLHWEHEHFNRD